MRRVETVRRELSDHNPRAQFLEGMDSALVGWTRGLGGLAVYNRELCIRSLVTMGMAREAAEEFFWSNVEGAWMGNTRRSS